MREEIMKIIFVLILGMSMGAALNGYYHGERVDELNKSISEFNSAVQSTFGEVGNYE